MVRLSAGGRVTTFHALRDVRLLEAARISFRLEARVVSVFRYCGGQKTGMTSSTIFINPILICVGGLRKLSMEIRKTIIVGDLRRSLRLS